MIKKLIVIEDEVTESKTEYSKGEKYSYFQDPETGKYYRPKDTFIVSGENLDDLFVEVEDENLGAG